MTQVSRPMRSRYRYLAASGVILILLLRYWVEGGMVGFRSLRLKPHHALLCDELRRLEKQARSARTATGAPFSRSLLARESGVSEETLAEWLDWGRPPKDNRKLLRVVRVLSAWAGQGTPSATQWPELWAATRQDSAAVRNDGTDSASTNDKHWTRRASVWITTTAVAALIGGLFAAFGSDLASHVPLSARTPSASSTTAGTRSTWAGTETLQAQASWCCRFTSITASTGIYWPGSAASLSSALDGV